MGGRLGPRESAAHERNHDVHVRQLPPDLQHHDGLHAVQEPNPRDPADQPGLHQVRVAEDQR